MSQERKRLLEILDYWHMIEFFAPFGLDQRIDALEKWQTRKLFHQFLHYCDDDSWRIIDWPPDKEILGFNLYVGIFDKSVASQVCRQYLPEPPGKPAGGRNYEECERANLEGATCFAKIKLNRQGVPLLDSIAISTLPWALNQLRTQGLKAFESDAFKKEREKIRVLVDGFLTSRGNSAVKAITANEVIALHQSLCEWAEFTPDPAQPTAVLEAIVRDKTLLSDGTVATSPTAPSAADVASESQPPVPNDNGESERKLTVNILNSVFLHEIERAMTSARGDKTPKALYRYLTPLPIDQRIPLHEAQGHEAIYQTLHPKHFGSGRWLSSPTQAMSLTQQFSINAILRELQEEGLFSVTWLPGTGKTALLRELSAENIVRRARVLAGLTHARDAFSPDGQVDLFFQGDIRRYRINTLIPALTGFEMVVASSSATSVEGIPDSLNQRGGIDPRWKETGYLQPVAHNFSVHVSEGAYSSPKGGQMPWGLIGYAMGKSGLNRQTRQHLAFNTADTRSDEPPLMLWDWLKHDHPQTFAQAAQEFREADKLTREALAKRGRLADLIELFRTTTEPQFLLEQQANVDQARRQLADADAALEETKNQLEESENKLKRLRSAEQAIERNRPFWLWLARLLKTRAAELYSSEKSANANRQVETRHQCEALRKTLSGPLKENQKNAAAQLRIREHELRNRQALWLSHLEECQSLKQSLGMPKLPEDLAQLEDDAFQMQGLWHDETIATLRSDLFAKALAVQQAWLAEVGKSGGGFDTSLNVIARMLTGQKIVDPAHYLPVWQSLFMVVPVITTDFTSFAFLFKELEPNALGWLFIDDAERTPPQTAVGALWRAKRVVTIGDTQQVEPVYSAPDSLIHALARLSPHTAEGGYAPNRASAQHLADRANRYGAVAHASRDTAWIGSPLRVHRRCIEPMFSLSNAIAYEGKMLFGAEQRSAPEGPPVAIPSCWVDLRGMPTREHAVGAQTRFMVEVLARIYRRDGRLPELYVLSPFKEIARTLGQALETTGWGIEGTVPPPAHKELKTWLRTRVGTVHTFQGKARDTVFMLLGADREHPESAQWAASKPNLLNTALTRAQRRFYLVGDYELWSPLPFFNASIQGQYSMPRIDLEQFVLSIGH